MALPPESPYFEKNHPLQFQRGEHLSPRGVGATGVPASLGLSWESSLLLQR